MYYFFLLVIGPRIATVETLYRFVAVAMFSKSFVQHRWQGGLYSRTWDHAGPMQGPPIGVSAHLSSSYFLSFLCLLLLVLGVR